MTDTPLDTNASNEQGGTQYSIPTQTQKQEWAAQQSALKAGLVLEDDHPDWSITFKQDCSSYYAEHTQGIKYVGGVDLSFIVSNNEDAIASLIILSFPSLKVVYEDHAKVKLTLPYIAGYLAFREVGPLQALVQNLRTNRPELEPQVIFVDGCGILHPRGFGLASHLGLLTGIPTIGCSKNFLVIHGDGDVLGSSPTEIKVRFRDYLAQNANTAEGMMLLQGTVTGKVYGAALSASTSRVAEGAQNPIYVSVGHKLSLETAVALVRACSQYRIPEPIRQADLKSRKEIRKWCEELAKTKTARSNHSNNNGQSSSRSSNSSNNSGSNKETGKR
ncbi:hypothetical protein BGW38_003177 [Lunasporangiospora selenospora]|uniref:Endonuclease V n=1 Tax=Lunasporangiospora selenospora TaxID=979761 RepID=A0A9P6FT44_9FUNG|nr:hypothetical protein BGW38_003177 [Lunasporangiospora selenospora]